MVRRNQAPQYGPKKSGRLKANEARVGSTLFRRDPEGRVMAYESDMEPYLVRPDKVPEKLRKPTGK